MGTLILAAIPWLLAIVVVVLAFIPMWNTDAWWVRILDFPRLQIALAGAGVLVTALFVPGPTRIVVPALMIAACGYQLRRIAP